MNWTLSPKFFINETVINDNSKYSTPSITRYNNFWMILLIRYNEYEINSSIFKRFNLKFLDCLARLLEDTPIL